MNRNHFWKLCLILFVLVWSVYEMYPPTSRDLVEFFGNNAVRASQNDPTFKAIVARAQALQLERKDQAYNNLRDAIGTNDITRFFAHIAPDAAKEPNPTVTILNELQRRAAGRIKLGLDLQGGTSVVVEMDTNRLSELSTNEYRAVNTRSVLSQAVEVLRKRVDRFGVAEPLIQPE